MKRERQHGSDRGTIGVLRASTGDKSEGACITISIIATEQHRPAETRRRTAEQGRSEMFGEVGVMHVGDLDPVGGNTFNHQLRQATTAGGRELEVLTFISRPVLLTVFHVRHRGREMRVTHVGDRRRRQRQRAEGREAGGAHLLPQVPAWEKDICAGLLPHLTLLPRVPFTSFGAFTPLSGEPSRAGSGAAW